MGLIVVELLIGGILAVVLTVIGLFFGHIIIFDSIALAIVAGFVSHGVFHIHPALSLLIGIVTFFGLFFLQNTKVGFWIIGGLLSLIWGFIFAMMAYEFTSKDMIWTNVVFGLATLIMIGLHIKARNRYSEV
ncbi:hypothetical protein LJC61_04640 [Ruminococcaceae bacterium OttesenSCG-928-A16]|nr:hypothetical protein [Eubacteriales bacterium OttesenSCG-928-N13]MDL2324421.1 hypothetical protein [Ruminococcaceae bacterium OttesenSCG-928-A16]